MLVQHNLSYVDIENVKDDQTFIREESFDSGFEGLNWRFDFISHICRINFCKCLFFNHYTRYRIIGSKDNIEITKEFIDFILPVIQILSEQEYLKKVVNLREEYHITASSFFEALEWFQVAHHWRLDKKQIMPASYADNMKDKEQKYYIKDLIGVFNFKKNKFIDDFMLGFVLGLSKKIKEGREKQEQNIQSSTNALVIFHDKKIQEFIKINHPHINHVSKKYDYGQGYNLGYDKGLNFDLSKKVKDKKQAVLN